MYAVPQMERQREREREREREMRAGSCGCWVASSYLEQKQAFSNKHVAELMTIRHCFLDRCAAYGPCDRYVTQQLKSRLNENKQFPLSDGLQLGLGYISLSEINSVSVMVNFHSNHFSSSFNFSFVVAYHHNNLKSISAFI